MPGTLSLYCRLVTFFQEYAELKELLPISDTLSLIRILLFLPFNLLYHIHFVYIKYSHMIDLYKIVCNTSYFSRSLFKYCVILIFITVPVVYQQIWRKIGCKQVNIHIKYLPTPIFLKTSLFFPCIERSPIDDFDCKPL